MKYCTILSLILLLCQPSFCDEKIMYTRSSSDLGEVILFITESRIESLKPVDLRTEEAPVTIGEACKVAEKFLRKKRPQYEKFEIYWVTFQNDRNSTGVFSAYDVSFYAWKKDGVGDGSPSVITATILMDGKAVDFMPEAEWNRLK